MIQIFDYEQWHIYDGAFEGSGRSEKIWLQSNLNDKIGLFKYPKSEETTEFISEKLAASIAEILEIPVAKVEIGRRNGRIGCISFQINTNDTALIEGINFINKFKPLFDKNKLFDYEKQEYYSLPMIFEVMERFIDAKDIAKFRQEFLCMLIFDALIGNTDRHQSNWALLQDKDKLQYYKTCPLYDNGSSLCAYEDVENVRLIMNDKTRFNAITDSKSRSRVRINSKVKKEPTHREVLEYIKDNYRALIMPFVNDKIRLVDRILIGELLEEFPSKILPESKKLLIFEYLVRKVEIINSIFVD